MTFTQRAKQLCTASMKSGAVTKFVVTSFRSRKHVAALLLCGLCLFASFSRAQTSAPAPKVLKLEDALNYALQHYPAVRASLEQVTAAHSGVTLARTQYLPQLSGVYQVSRATQNQVPGIWLLGPATDQSYWGSQAAVLFSWEPFDFGLRSAKVGQAQSAEARSRAGLALTQLQVATAVGDYFLLAVAPHLSDSVCPVLGRYDGPTANFRDPRESGKSRMGGRAKRRDRKWQNGNLRQPANRRFRGRKRHGFDSKWNPRCRTAQVALAS